MSKAENIEREIIEYISNAAIELAFTRHELTTTDYEETDYPDVEEGVEAFKALVEDVKADVLACLTGDAESCLDPEDIAYDTELLWLKRKLTRLEPHLVGEAEIRADERTQILARVEPLIPRYDEFDNFHPAGKDIDPRYAAGWNALYAVLEAATKVAPPKGEQSA